MEYKIEFHPAALKEFCELDGSKKQTDLFALNGTHSKAKNVSSQANTSLRAVCIRGNYLKRRSRILRIRLLKKTNGFVYFANQVRLTGKGYGKRRSRSEA